ncbi:hypothetical protein I317_00732 [Kwoniella heveanensis CBS 569]|nr:hypothetical protein I317_00732 [Kwoniella heveanensis CBS 569]
MPRARLPPLPPSSAWSKHFPSRYLPVSPDRIMIRKAPGRILLSNPVLCDNYVKSLKLREGEVVIESYAGVGALTRSLISGGDSVGEAKRWDGSKLDVPAEGEVTTSQGSGKSVIKKKKKRDPKEFPIWLEALPPPLPEAERPKEDDKLVKPRLVVASEGSSELLLRAFDYPSSHMHTNSHAVTSSSNPELESGAGSSSTEGISNGSTITDTPGRSGPPIVQSPYEPNLLLSHSTSYVWSTLPLLLENPLVSEHLPVYDASAAPGPETTKRPWKAPEPPITLVAQLPDSSIGEQLAAQWVGSAVGDPDQQRTWIWEWGRLRLALLCGKSLYDRILAKPGDIINCKLSILAQALFDIVPLPPYHHVQNVDKQSKFTVDRPVKYTSLAPKSNAKPIGMPTSTPSDFVTSSLSATSEGLVGERLVGQQKTITYPGDFWPPPTTSTKAKAKPLERPPLLGLMLIPKIETPILAAQKDTWDYVMRRLFVRDTMTLKDSIPNLAFGAEILLKRIQEDGMQIDEKTGENKVKWRGVPVDESRVIRELHVEEWLRIVDVFDKWAFKPDNLILDSGGLDENIRELGQD